MYRNVSFQLSVGCDLESEILVRLNYVQQLLPCRTADPEIKRIEQHPSVASRYFTVIVTNCMYIIGIRSGLIVCVMCMHIVPYYLSCSVA
jgi:hypothetical protein